MPGSETSAPVIGAVVNKLDIRTSGYSYSYYDNYGYYYTEAEQEAQGRTRLNPQSSTRSGSSRMRTYLVAFVLSLLTGLVLTRVLRDLANRYGLYDSGGGRKIHKQPIPGQRGRRIVDVSAAWSGILAERHLARAVDGPAPAREPVGRWRILFAVGLLDDLRDMRAIIKLMAQVAAGSRSILPVCASKPSRYRSFACTARHAVASGHGVLDGARDERRELIDGMDGLAGGVVVLAGGTLFIMSVIEDNVSVAVLLACVGSTMGRPTTSTRPPSPGDAGSLTLGFLLALTAVHSSQKSYTLFSIVAAMMALGCRFSTSALRWSDVI